MFSNVCVGHACSVKETELSSMGLVDSRQHSVDEPLEVLFVRVTPFYNCSLLFSFVGDLDKGFHEEFVSVPTVVHEKGRHLQVLRETVEKHTIEPSWLSIGIRTSGIESLVLPRRPVKTSSFAEILMHGFPENACLKLERGIEEHAT